MKHLPADRDGNSAVLEVAEGATPIQVMEQLGLPLGDSYLVILNGASVPRAERAERRLAEGDLLAIMPPLVISYAWSHLVPPGSAGPLLVVTHTLQGNVGRRGKVATFNAPVERGIEQGIVVEAPIQLQSTSPVAVIHFIAITASCCSLCIQIEAGYSNTFGG